MVNNIVKIKASLSFNFNLILILPEEQMIPLKKSKKLLFPVRSTRLLAASDLRVPHFSEAPIGKQKYLSKEAMFLDTGKWKI